MLHDMVVHVGVQTNECTNAMRISDVIMPQSSALAVLHR